MDDHHLWSSLRQRLCPYGRPPYVALPQREALCPSDRGSLSLRQRISVPQTEALCPLDRGSLTAWRTTICGPPSDRGSLSLEQRLSVPRTECLCPSDRDSLSAWRPPFVALAQTVPPSVALSLTATLASPVRAARQITARLALHTRHLPWRPDI